MNTTSKMLIAVAIALNISAIAAVTGLAMQQQSQGDRVDLGRIVVTPADSNPGTVNLGAILVTPSDADWSYAETRGVQRPAMKTIALGSIVVTPTAEQLAELADAGITRHAPDSEPVTAENVVPTSLVEALASFTPGKYLSTDTVLRALNALVFEHSGS
jgi:hypothetical protein